MRIAMGVESLRMRLDCRRVRVVPARQTRNTDYRTGGTQIMIRV